MTDEQPTILFVDDEPNILKALRRSFIEEDYQMHFAGSGAEGLTLLENEPVDLVVSDVRMPEMDGIEFLSLVKERYPAVGRILLSGYAEKTSIVKALAEGCAQQVLAKPWDDKELKEVVRDALQQLRQQKQQGLPTQSLINSLSHLPPLPRIYHELRDCLADRDNYTIDQVVNIVRQDAAISADLLRWANCALFGQRGKVDSVKRAILLMGTDVVEHLVLSLAIERSVGSMNMNFDHRGLQKHAMSCAVIARLLAQEQPGADPQLADNAFIAGLLHDLGVLAGAGIYPDAYAQIGQLAEKRLLLLTEAESEILHTSHQEIGAILADWWTLPPFIASAIRWHLEPEKATEHRQIVELVALANALSCEFELGVSGNHRHPEMAEELKARYGLTPELIEQLREKAKAAI